MPDAFDDPFAALEAQAAPPLTNAPELSVSDLASALKRTIETAYDFVRVRGELGRVVAAKSGHLYFDLKDDKACLNAVMWKLSAGRPSFRPEEGLEVVAEGRLSTYAGRSSYQLICERMRPAGIGALLQQLEERKKRLAAEGLFDPARKKKLPYLPGVIGVVTSPTGAVIRDILHRVRERFPCRVLIWPSLVQGQLAAEQVEAGIRGFNALPAGGAVPRPDVIIVARGGGSIEDLWPFNEERVVRAAADSVIPLISAVGHETDTTLIDFVSDRRAPTPTGAAEIAVPVRADLIAQVDSFGARKLRCLGKGMERRRLELRSAARRLPRLDQLAQGPRLRLDAAARRFEGALDRLLSRRRARFADVGGRMRPAALAREVAAKRPEAQRLASRLDPAMARRLQAAARRLEAQGRRVQPASLLRESAAKRRALARVGDRLRPAAMRAQGRTARRLEAVARVLQSLSYENVLKRGYALVTAGEAGARRLVRSAGEVADGQRLFLRFADGEATAVAGQPGAKAAPSSPAEPPFRPRIRTRRPPDSETPEGGGQGDLF